MTRLEEIGAKFCHPMCYCRQMNIRLRHDAILRILRRNGTSTVNDLAGEVGASRRTVLRDVAALRDQGFVIHSEAGRGGGLQLDPESVQTTARLSVAEVFALLISVATMRAARSLPFSDLADAGLAKIERGHYRQKRCETYAGSSTACISDSFRPSRIFRTWV